MPHPRLSALGFAIAGALNSLPLAAATNAELEARLLELTQKVSQLEAALAANRQPAAVPAAPAPDPALARKVAVLERKLEIADEEAARKKLETPLVTAGEKGFALTSPDKAWELKLRGYVQADGRFVADDDTGNVTDTFTLRRVRPIFEGTLWKYYSFRIMPDFGGNTTVLQDAHLDANFLPEFRVRAGKFKSPFGLERLQSGTDIRFVERGLPTNLVPNRDLGVQLYGDLWGGVASYAVGYFNGVADGGSSNSDATDDKEFAGRLFFQPFKNRFGPLQGLGVGIAGSYGDTHGVEDLGAYRTQAQATFFSYRNDPVAPTIVSADGNHYRFSPQGYWYFKQFGLLGEYVRSVQDVELGAARDTLEHDAWQLLGSWVITGEENSFKSVTPKSSFDPFKGQWGAWELVARYSELDVDDDAFPVFASPTSRASLAEQWGVGLNWYLNRNYRVYANYEQTDFEGGATGGRDRNTEEAFFTRFQVSF